MKSRLFLLSSLLLVLAAFAPAQDAKKDTEKLQGKWVAETKGGKLEMTFDGDKFTVLIDGETGKGTFKLNTSKNPKEMDMTVTESPTAEAKGKTALCIYAFDGEKLQWSSNSPGGNTRPKEFKEDSNEPYFYAVLKRVK
jgi:uncharacterized protein (TIGR03067 family)